MAESIDLEATMATWVGAFAGLPRRSSLLLNTQRVAFQLQRCCKWYRSIPSPVQRPHGQIRARCQRRSWEELTETLIVSRAGRLSVSWL